MRREWIEMFMTIPKSRAFVGLPPCGGSGLKLYNGNHVTEKNQVSLHAEGVD